MRTEEELNPNWVLKGFPPNDETLLALFPTKKPKCSNKVAEVNLILYDRYLTYTLTFFSVSFSC